MKKKEAKISVPAIIGNEIMSLYLLIMLGFFPVYYRYQYSKMGNSKYQLFKYASVICVVLMLLVGVVGFLLQIKKNGWKETKQKLSLKGSLLDKAVLIYFLCTSVSYIFCGFLKDGFFGASGWFMGYLSQLLFVAIYFFVSRAWKFNQNYLWILLVTSAIAFLVGILHRFNIDPFDIYGELELKYKMQFLSTMGQSSWYSSFLCTVFPVGLYLFFVADKALIRRLSGVFSVLAMLSLVTQNTDSAFMCLAAVLLVLFYLAFDGRKQMLRFLEVLILIFGSFTFMGVCQRVFADRVIPIDSLSIFMSQGWVSPVILLLAIGLYFWKREALSMVIQNEELKRSFFWILVVVAGIAAAVVVLFIILNSTGFLYTHFGYQNENNYLLFTDKWGNQRGFAWRFTAESYAGLPFYRKLIGVGPDCYSFYNASVPELAEQVKAFWGKLSLTNAHNEYLTKLYNLGAVGVLSYVFMLGSAVYIFIKKRKDHILLPAFALCVVSYMTHLIFCYEQVCCTPIFYILIGFGSNLIHNKEGKSAY